MLLDVKIGTVCFSLREWRSPTPTWNEQEECSRNISSAMGKNLMNLCSLWSAINLDTQEPCKHHSALVDLQKQRVRMLIGTARSWCPKDFHDGRLD